MSDAPAGTQPAGCDACREIGPLATAPGTSGRSWRCESCGTTWQGAGRPAPPVEPATCRSQLDASAAFPAYGDGIVTCEDDVHTGAWHHGGGYRWKDDGGTAGKLFAPSVEPSTTPDPLIDAFTAAYWGQRGPRGQLVPVPERIAAGLAAVRPLIEDEAGARIADAIEAHAQNFDAYQAAYLDAARIARGEQP